MIGLQAHKGVECEYPENTMASFRAAVEQGYRWIELDLGVTKDSVFVTLHNETVNATARTDDGRELPSPVRISDLTFDEARKLDFGLSFSEKFRGERIPDFRNVLALAEKSGVGLKLDNKMRRFPPETLDRLFGLLSASRAKIGMSCWDTDIVRRVRAELPRAEIHYDGLTDENGLRTLAALVPREQCVIWLPVDYDRASWAPREWFATDERVTTVKRYFRLGLWAVRDRASFDRICARWQPDLVETNGLIKPYMIT